MKHGIVVILAVVALFSAAQVREDELQKKIGWLLPDIGQAIGAEMANGSFSAVVPLPNVGWRDRDALYAYLRLKGYRVQDNGEFGDAQAAIVRW